MAYSTPADASGFGAEDEPQRVGARRVDDRLALERDLAIVKKLAHLLDSQFDVGGVKFGLDSLIGLIPGIGDAATTALAAYPVWLAHRHNLGKRVIARMVGNLLIDFLVGIVPLLGDVFDVAFKANLKNLRLFEEAARKRGVESKS